MCAEACNAYNYTFLPIFDMDDHFFFNVLKHSRVQVFG